MSKEEEITETGNGSGEEELSTDKLFEQVYTAFKLHFYRDVFGNFGNREATLTTVEAFCMEVIYAMKNPTINEFADFIKISSPNAAYKVNNLVSKGYLKKVQSKKDKRRYYLQVTQKYIDYYSVSSVYVKNVMDRLKQDMTPEEIAFATERIAAAGAAEVYTVPAGMKKGRPGIQITAFCAPDRKEAVLSAFFKHTSTIGVRAFFQTGYRMESRVRKLETPDGTVHIKESTGFNQTRRKADYDDAASLAIRENISLREARERIRAQEVRI